MGLKLSTRANRGSELESLIDISQRGIICVEKMTAGVRWIKGVPTPTAGPVDYVGEVCGGGRSICFDAKQCGKAGGFSVRDYVKPHQLDYLQRHGRAGAVAGILVGATHPDVSAYLWLDWEDVGRFASVAWEEEVWVEAGRWGGMVEWGRIPGVKSEQR